MHTLSIKDFSSELNGLLPRVMRGFTGRQYLVMEFIREKGPQVMTALAHQAMVSLPAMTGLVDRLYRHDYIRRVLDSSDRRIVRIELTKRGREILEDVNKKRRKRIAFVFGQISKKERQQYLNILRKIGQIVTVFIITLNITIPSFCQQRKTISASIDEISKLALENNFEIQMAKYDAYIKQNDLDADESIFDTVILASATYEKDKLKPASTLAGTENTYYDYNFGLEKKLSTGTTLEAGFLNEKDTTDSPFVSLNPAYETTGKLKLTQEMGKNFFGLIDRGDIKITKLDIENSDYTSLEKIENYLADAQKAYWSLTLTSHSLKIQNEMLDTALNLQKINQKRLKTGLVENPQSFASDANVKKRQEGVLTAINTKFLAMSDLLYRLNLRESVVIEPADELGFEMKEMPDYAETLKSAFGHRRDYSKAKNDLIAKGIKLEMKQNNMWPEVNLELSLIRNGLDDKFSKAFGDVFSENNPEYYVGIDFKLPLENRLAKSALSTAELEKAKAILEVKRVERRLLADINNALNTLNTANNKQKLAAEIVGLQKKKLSAEQERYSAGRSDSDTIIRYQDDLLTAWLEYVQAMYNARAAYIDFLVSADMLLDNYWEGVL